MYKTAYLF